MAISIRTLMSTDELIQATQPSGDPNSQQRDGKESDPK